jgi:hypothetical protein
VSHVRPDHIEQPGGGSNERFAKANFTHARLEVYPDNRTIFDAITAGRADVMVTDGQSRESYEADILLIHSAFCLLPT